MKKRIQALRNLQQMLPDLDRSVVVDVGANPTGRPPYRDLMRAEQALVFGFEPDPRAFDELKDTMTANLRYVNSAIGDGETATLYVCAASYMTSLLRPDIRSMALFPQMARGMEVIDEIEIRTQKLDKIDEIKEIDLLKIDVQGSELAVFRNGRAKLSKALCVQTEVSFFPIYEDQPSLGDIDQELRAQGFLPHDMTSIHRNPVAPYRAKRRFGTQLLDGDFIYLRDLRDMDRFTDRQLMQLAAISLGYLEAPEIAVRALQFLRDRGYLSSSAIASFVQVNQRDQGRYEL